jgi:hypothetical protein
MNQEEIKAKSLELAALFTAKANGKTLQVFPKNGLQWYNAFDDEGPSMDSDLSSWRVKPEEVKEETTEVLP